MNGPQIEWQFLGIMLRRACITLPIGFAVGFLLGKLVLS